jgi:hypothetical protein
MHAGQVSIRAMALVLPLMALATAPQQSGSKQPTSRQNHAKPALMKTPLTSIDAVTDIDAPRDPDDPGTGGGADYAGYFSRRLAIKVSTCTDRIRSITDAWAKENQLVVSKSDHRSGDLLMHLVSGDLDGFFEVAYRVRLQQERARVTLFFYSTDGSRHEPSGIRQLLDRYHVGHFQDDLTKAILCGDR